MIIKGGRAGNVAFWSSHLLRTDTNDRAAVIEQRGVLADDLRGALREMQAVASGSRCNDDFMYQANINPRADEHLTPEQWREAVDRLEKNLGFEGHARVVVEHVKEGRQHYHVIWNRVGDDLRAVSPYYNYLIHERTAQELERDFGLEPVQENGAGGPPFALWEQQKAERTAIEPATIKAELTDLWNRSDSGPAFVAGLEEQGYVLARGDRRDFCIVDHAGTAHSLARRLDGVKTTEVRAFLSDIDRDSLPTVAEAREAQRDRFADPAEAWANRTGAREAETAPALDASANPFRAPVALEASEGLTAATGPEPGADRAPRLDGFDAVAGAPLAIAGRIAESLGSLFDGSTPLSPKEQERLAERDALRDEAAKDRELERRLEGSRKATNQQDEKRAQEKQRDDNDAYWIALARRGRERDFERERD
jgi:hypothetical protein